MSDGLVGCTGAMLQREGFKTAWSHGKAIKEPSVGSMGVCINSSTNGASHRAKGSMREGKDAHLIL